MLRNIRTTRTEAYRPVWAMVIMTVAVIIIVVVIVVVVVTQRSISSTRRATSRAAYDEISPRNHLRKLCIQAVLRILSATKPAVKWNFNEQQSARP